MRTLIFISVFAFFFSSCGKKKASDPLADSGRTQRTENLCANMRAQADSAGYMFGHQDTYMYGIGWCGDSMRSDVKSITGDMPAVFGLDLGHIETGDSLNLDGVSFEKMRKAIFSHFARGGVVTISWHCRNPLTGNSAWVNPDSITSLEKTTVASVLEGGKMHDKYISWLDRVADFFNSLETPYGVKVPVIFRPYHEHTGSWFWWGERLCTKEQYTQLWKMTVERMKEKGVTNLLWAYSPGIESHGDSIKYMERYLGDDIVDVMGLDYYCSAGLGDTVAVAKYAEDIDRELGMVCSLAEQHKKVAAFTETGFSGIKDDNWWTRTLMPVLSKHPIAYVLLWRNAHDMPEHFFVPFPGQPSSTDFVKFYNDRKTLFLSDVNGLYLD